MGDFTNFSIKLPSQSPDESTFNIKILNIFEYITLDIEEMKHGSVMNCPDTKAIEAALYIGSKLPLFLPSKANSWNSIWNGIKKFVSKEPIQSLINVGTKFLPTWAKVGVQAANKAITGKPYIEEKIDEKQIAGGFNDSFQTGLDYN